MSRSRIGYFIIATVSILLLIYFLGPRVSYAPVDTMPIDASVDAEGIEQYIADREASMPIRPGNGTIIRWADSVGRKTDYAIVYLHGFSASPVEGLPVLPQLAEKYRMNLYMPILHDHGLEGRSVMEHLTPQDYVASAKEAIAIGRELGDSLILASCSTGGTLSIMLAPQEPRVAGMIMYSPNIDLYDKRSSMLLKPWGKHILHLIKGEENVLDYTPEQAAYWYERYHAQSILAVKTLIRDYMHADQFAKIDIPIFMGYYYKDAEHQDDVVSVPRMLDFFEEVSTPPHLKRKVAFPEAGAHVICSDLFSEAVPAVQRETEAFMESIFGFKPKANVSESPVILVD